MNNKTHGRCGTPEYRTWRDMKNRCYNHKNADYKHYGGRGIVVCERWRNSFMNFYSDMGPRPKDLTLERKNNDGDYEPGNCKWVSMREQRRNSRQNRIIEFNGKKQCLADWAKEFGKCQHVVR